MDIKQEPEDFVVEEIPSFSLSSKGEYGIYCLEKRLANTESAIQEISRRLQIQRKNIGYSGAKDRRAITRQYISIRNFFRKDQLQFKNMTLKYSGRSQKPLSLGSHLGNEFEIVVRKCKTEPKKIDRMVNYFGRQRFSSNNSEVGRLLVKKNFEKAANLIDDPRISSWLEKRPNDYVGALKRIPMKTSTLYVHSYQSLLWNEVAENLSRETSENLRIPILGFRTEFSDPRIEKIYKKILEKENLKIKDFIIRQWPELSSEGSARDIYVELDDLLIEKFEDGVYKLKFFLPKGSYATVALDQIFDETK